MAKLSADASNPVGDGRWSEFDARARQVLPDLRSAALRLAGDPDDASELVQRTLIRMWRRDGAYSGKGSYAGWAVAILRNLWKDSLKRAANEPQWVPLEECEDLAAPHADPLNEIWEQRRAAALHTALGRLKSAEREAFVAHHVDDTPLSEIAEEMGVSRRHAAILVQRACDKLKSQDEFLELAED